MTKVITLNYRRARTKEEKGDWAETTLDSPDLATVYINRDKNRTSKELADTFFHEMAHIFIHFHGAKKIDRDVEEKLCQQIGRACEGILR